MFFTFCRSEQSFGLPLRSLIIQSVSVISGTLPCTFQIEAYCYFCGYVYCIRTKFSALTFMDNPAIVYLRSSINFYEPGNLTWEEMFKAVYQCVLFILGLQATLESVSAKSTHISDCID